MKKNTKYKLKKKVVNVIITFSEIALAVFFCVITLSNNSTKTTVKSENLNNSKIIDDRALIVFNEKVGNGKVEISSDMFEPEVILPKVEKKIEFPKVSTNIELKQEKNEDVSLNEVIIPSVVSPLVPEESKELPVEENDVQKKEYNVIETYIGSLTGYGNDCKGCGHMTAADYDISETIYYDDPEFGQVRIVAAGTVKKDDSTKLPFYSIVRISNVSNMDPVIAIVLDRGGSVGYGKVTLFDLLFESESVANSTIGKRRDVTFELLRRGK